MSLGVYKQTITYWSEAALDGFGNRSFDAPILLIARFEERTDLMIAFEGEMKPSNAVVYVQQDVVLGGFLAVGDRISIPDPTTLTDAYIIKSFEKMPSLNGGDVIRKVLL